jgi:hypothetical protein
LVVGGLAAQLSRAGGRIWLSKSHSFHALQRGRSVSEFFKARIRARNRTISNPSSGAALAVGKKWITNHDAKTDSPSPKQASKTREAHGNLPLVKLNGHNQTSLPSLAWKCIGTYKHDFSAH